MRWLRRHIATAGGAQPCHHVLDHDGGRGNPIAFLFRHVEPEPGYCRIEFLSGHVIPLLHSWTWYGRGLASQQLQEDLVKRGWEVSANASSPFKPPSGRTACCVS